jgi:hypothetical protein
MSYFVVLVAILGFSAPIIAQGNPSTNSAQIATAPVLSLAIRVKGDVLEHGKSIPLTITITNTSDTAQPFKTLSFHPEYSYFKWSLSLASHPVHKTAFYRMLFNEQEPGDPAQVAEGRSMWVKLQPGESFTLTSDLSRLFEIKEPGIYILDVSLRDNSASEKSAAELSLTVQ